LRKLALFAPAFALLFVAQFASAQQADIMVGGGTLLSASYATNLVNPGPISEKGGFYPSISGDVIGFKRRVGFNFEVTWRGKQGEYGGPGGQPYRPIIYDFNAMYQPKLGKKIGADLMAGIGAQSTRFYGFTNTSGCVYFGACFVSSNHFLVDIGGGVRYYVWNHVFVRPEAHFYHIVNNTNDFNSNNVVRVGASIGFTIGPD